MRIEIVGGRCQDADLCEARLVAMKLRRAIFMGAAFAVVVLPALAVEGAVGRTLPGVWVMPEVDPIGWTKKRTSLDGGRG
jgi:hypothetical protein